MRRALALLAAAFAIIAVLTSCTSSPSRDTGRAWLSPMPATVCASADCGEYGATLNWVINFPGTTGYNVFLNGSQIASVSSSPYTFTGMDCETTFTLGVQAHNAAGGTSAMRSVTHTTPACPSQFPLQVSANGRSLEDANGTPFLVVGDSPQSVIGNLSETNAFAYLDDRETQGFNATWINLLCTDYTGCQTNGQTADSIKPFTTGTTPTGYDLSTPNTAGGGYFARAHDIIARAKHDGIAVFLDPIPTDNCLSGGWITTLESNGNGTTSTGTKDYQYGQFLGTYFGDLNNIVWQSGNDFNCISTTADNNNAKAVAMGIANTDPSALQTLESDDCAGDGCEGSTSLLTTAAASTGWASLVQINSAYSYSPSFAIVHTAYGENNGPSILGEANYEGQILGSTDGCGAGFASDATARHCRIQEWWTMTSGGAGNLYGGNYVAMGSFANADEGSFGIQNGFVDANIDTTGAAQLKAQATFLRTIAWQTLAPDTSHALVTSGFQASSDCSATTGLMAANTCVTTAADSFTDGDATLALSYLPDPSTFASPVVDLAKFGGPVTAEWVDPTTGSISAPISGSPFTASGTHTFTPSTNNAAGNKDWALLLTATPSGGAFSVSCPLTYAAGAGNDSKTANWAEDGTAGGSTCWGDETGVYAGTGDTEAQIEANPTSLGFTHVTSDVTLSTNGQTLNKEWIDGGCINVRANNVTIENVLITDSGPDCSGGSTAATAIDVDQDPAPTGTLIEDTTIDGTDNGAESNNKDPALTINDGEVLRVNLFGWAQGYVSDTNDASHAGLPAGGGSLIQDSYGHDYTSCEHDDGTWFDTGVFVNMQHDWIETNDPTSVDATGCATGACVGGSDFGPEHDITVNASFCDGGTDSPNDGDGENYHSGCGGTNMVVTNNVFDGTAGKTNSYGAWNPSDSGNVWTNNKFIDHSGNLSTANPQTAADAGC